MYGNAANHCRILDFKLSTRGNSDAFYHGISGKRDPNLDWLIERESEVKSVADLTPSAGGVLVGVLVGGECRLRVGNEVVKWGCGRGEGAP